MNFKNLSKLQIVVILGGILLTVLLLLAPKKGAPVKQEAELNNENNSLQSFVDSLKTLADKGLIVLLAEQEKKSNYDSISKLWIANKQPIAAAFYLQKNALQNNTASNWEKAAKLYYSAAKFADEKYRQTTMGEAIACYQQSLEMDSTNLQTKVGLAVCYVEATNEPMKGIMMLRDVLKKDSTNIEAHVNLGLFAIQSGQFEKAIDRFNKILKINPDYLEAYIYLGQIYANMGNKTKAIEVLEKYKKLNNNEIINTEINNYINELKNS